MILFTINSPFSLLHILQQHHSRQSDDAGSVKSGVDDLDIEHDTVDLPGPRARLLRLKSGGSAFGSRESLQNLGLETDEVPAPIAYEETPVELSLKTPSREKVLLPGQEVEDENFDSSITLLSELESQYQALVMKYEAMIEAKSQRPTRDIGTQDMVPVGDHAPGAPKGFLRPQGLALRNESGSTTNAISVKKKSATTSTSTSAATAAVATAAALVSTPPCHSLAAQTTVIHRSSPLDFKSPMNSVQNQYGSSPPEYKQLFKEIFETLRRSVVYEGTPKASPTKSPTKTVAGKPST